MPAKVLSCAIQGLNGYLVSIEAFCASGISTFSIVGLGDTAVHEAKERVFSAIKNSGYRYPQGKKIVNLAPADLKKYGPSFDLAIAISILIASNQIGSDAQNETMLTGELSLEGTLNPVKGVLAIASYAKKIGIKNLVVPYENGSEASLIQGINILPAHSLKDVCLHLLGEQQIESLKTQKTDFSYSSGQRVEQDIKDVNGQEHAKRALMISAAGGHNLLFSGPPGSGKTLLSKSILSILPDLDIDEALELSKIYSIAGLLPKDKPLIKERPFRTVHHSASMVSIIGGGHDLMPGEITLAHRGVLFFDEVLEFPTQVLESLRQPIEDGEIFLSRAIGKVVYPAKFVFIGSMNPCPCGYLGDLEKNCSCSDYEISRYQKKLSGPMLDRIDLFVNMPRIKFEKLINNSKQKSSKEIKEMIACARNIQKQRFKNEKIKLNNEMSSQLVKNYCRIDKNCQDLLRDAMKKFNLSARGYFRLLKTARTIADLEQSRDIKFENIAEALQFRHMEKF